MVPGQQNPKWLISRELLTLKKSSIFAHMVILMHIQSHPSNMSYMYGEQHILHKIQNRALTK